MQGNQKQHIEKNNPQGCLRGTEEKSVINRDTNVETHSTFKGIITRL